MAEAAEAKDPVKNEAVEAAAEASKVPGPSNDLKALPVRLYLDQTVTPLLLKAMSQLVTVRPEDPVAWLAAWLIKNNPNNKAEGES
mmetsp:Transcript_20287/g.28527  ORF Transcript_20287/g.28527 Transcript_20287/m.28527 type:complete len:86 (+) Transcript_20287:21-278(+)|eukprot:jgi/Bigna1/140956/aug1.59_g15664